MNSKTKRMIRSTSTSFDETIWCTLNADLHSIAWSMDLKDLGLPFRKFCMLWRASMALPRKDKTSLLFLSTKRHMFLCMYLILCHLPQRQWPPGPPWSVAACCWLYAQRWPLQRRGQSGRLGEESHHSKLGSHWLRH